MEQEELKNQLRAQLNAEQAEIAFDAVRKKLLEMEAQQSKEDIANLQRQVLEEHKVDIKLENNN
ncbi:hypothetical protein IJS64_03370 [bacterium]|nr:hypothetical protein [bacterium]